jgi:hypothetical protein
MTHISLETASTHTMNGHFQAGRDLDDSKEKEAIAEPTANL